MIHKMKLDAFTQRKKESKKERKEKERKLCNCCPWGHKPLNERISLAKHVSTGTSKNGL